MSNKPAITVTRLDMQRLEQVLDNLDDYDAAAEALEAELARANFVGHTEIANDIVTMNSKAHFHEASTATDYQLTLAYPEQGGGAGNVSVLAPIGTALLGLSVGQSIDWQTAKGKTLKLTLTKVEYQPEAQGDFTL
ncbi:nucleoside diphosphate kinase regulator [Denitrificimonas caeni]|uniref:Nucleoside diphosphate kinase regulator n=1 Tax=Denitrificimonas caeni TaxID=521720 RepID=A0AAE9VNC9_9GAMM|nr:nucleoside diphosphate kinase regulator [Denitrificimonas caeni]WBE25296.1 nucleoside diphosphate kinase regulator [Denitrificimonas caeni]